VIEAGVPGRFVKLKGWVAFTLPDAAETVKLPTVVFAVRTGAVATPDAFAVTDATVPLFDTPVPAANVAPALFAGFTVNVTGALAMGLLLESRTVTCSCLGNAVDMGVDWVNVTATGVTVPAAELVSWKSPVELPVVVMAPLLKLAWTVKVPAVALA
jgi:hypothetical protein